MYLNFNLEKNIFFKKKKYLKRWVFFRFFFLFGIIFLVRIFTFLIFYHLGSFIPMGWIWRWSRRGRRWPGRWRLITCMFSSGRIRWLFSFSLVMMRMLTVGVGRTFTFLMVSSFGFVGREYFLVWIVGIPTPRAIMFTFSLFNLTSFSSFAITKRKIKATIIKYKEYKKL